LRQLNLLEPVLLQALVPQVAFGLGISLLIFGKRVYVC
jgi:hypothetical protein